MQLPTGGTVAGAGMGDTSKVLHILRRFPVE